jgi:hypothetical protein
MLSIAADHLIDIFHHNNERARGFNAPHRCQRSKHNLRICEQKHDPVPSYEALHQKLNGYGLSAPLGTPEQHSTFMDKAECPVPVCRGPKRLHAGKHPTGCVIRQFDEIVTQDCTVLNVGSVGV